MRWSVGDRGINATGPPPDYAICLDSDLIAIAWTAEHAQLIARAPELLTALRRLRAWHKGEYQSNPTIDATVDALLVDLEPLVTDLDYYAGRVRRGQGGQTGQPT